jgi:RNA polymerase sigma-70 factor, ECF subfamily
MTARRNRLVGLAELARLVRDTLQYPTFSPALAGAAPSACPGGALRMLSEAHAVRPAHAEPARVPLDTPKVSEQPVDASHTETWQLVQAAQAGDGEAFGKLYDQYVDLVYRFIYFRVNDRALAEDFTSETFLRALRRISSITYQGRDIGAWFVTIARNIIYDNSKSARNRLEISTGEFFESAEFEPSPEASVIDSLTSETLIAGIKQLNDEQRECVVLRFIHGLSVSETAAAMGKNDGAIKALQHRAVRKLGDLIGGELR